MARLPRYVLPGNPQHVIQRGNNRSIIFHQKGDYLYYLDILKKASEKYDCEIHAYVLMTNHVHLLLTPQQENSISHMQQMIGRYYVRYFNDTYQRTGTLWEGRYKATLIDSEHYLLTCMRYIEMNPVRAKIVSSPDQYLWSSYKANAIGDTNSLIKFHPLYISLGSNNERRQLAYQQLFSQELPQRTVNDIRIKTNGGWVLGTDLFITQFEKNINRRLNPLPKGGDHRSNSYNDKINGC